MSSKGENIYKRKDGRWEGRYVKCHDSDGKIRYGYCYAKTYREVKQKLFEERKAHEQRRMEAEGNAEAEGKDGRNQVAARSFYTYCEEWLKLKRHGVKYSTYVKYHTILERHIKPEFEDCPLFGLDALRVEQFIQKLMFRDGLSVKTTRDILAVLRSVFSYIENEEAGFRHVEIVYPKNKRQEMRVLTREEQAGLMQYLLEDMDLVKFGILLTLLTGLRIGELCALRWEDVRLEQGLLRVSATMQRIQILGLENGVFRREGEKACDIRAKTQVIISDPKTFSSTREIPLSTLALKLCRQFYGCPKAYLLTGEEVAMEPRALQYRFAKMVSDCDLNDVHFHTLRHSFATRCVEVGFEIKSLSEILGHANTQITLDRYVHSSMELKKENMKKLSTYGY